MSCNDPRINQRKPTVNKTDHRKIGLKKRGQTIIQTVRESEAGAHSASKLAFPAPSGLELVEERKLSQAILENQIVEPLLE